MRHRLVFLLATFFLLASESYAQLKVSTPCYKKEGDISASTEAQNRPSKNAYGQNLPFALVRVGLAEENVKFEGKGVIESEFRDNEYWVRLLSTAKEMTIKSPLHEPLIYRFPIQLENNATYIMSINKVLGKLEISSNLGSKVKVYIDSCLVSEVTPFVFEGDQGEHELLVKADGYADEKRAVKIPANGTVKITVNLNVEGSLKVGNVSYGEIAVRNVSFSMGDNSFYYGRPVHTVQLRPFNVGKAMVSASLWKSVMGEVDENMIGANGQVVNVTYSQCLDFIALLNEKTGKSYRLPTEAEWEYCAKNAGKLGIEDMTRCREWCSDWFGHYAQSGPSPQGPATGFLRVVRGADGPGTYFTVGSATWRGQMNPESSAKDVSFRLASDN